jgi:hypothetical protein
LIQGKPGWWTAELNLESRSTARTSACRVTNQAWDPSQSVMRPTEVSSANAANSADGENGQPPPGTGKIKCPGAHIDS